jgi:uncharacterized protein (TIGR02231 family)
VFENLPVSLLPDSVRVKGAGAGIRILGIDVPYVQLSRTPDVTVAELQSNLEQLELRQKEIADELAGEEIRLKMTAAMRVSASVDLVKGLAWGKTGIDAMESLRSYADGQDTESRAKVRELGVKAKALQREIDAAKARLRQLAQPASEKRRNIVVSVESAAAGGAVELEVSYVCPAASWIPLYDARLQDSTVRITYLASVTQNTGEDWSDSTLSLSTARPAVTTEIPELSPWYLDMYVPPPPRAMMMASAMPRGGGAGEFTTMMSMPVPQSAAPAAEAMAAPPPPPVAEIMMANVEERGASATFHIPRKTSIPSDNTPHRTQIAEFDLPATLDYITAPKIADQAYLRATVRNNTSFVLLRGKANLFHGDEFVGTTTIEDTAAREFELQMGVDERVTVTRELVSRDVTKAFIGNTRKASYSYRIKLSHRLENSAKLLVLDQLPHSRHEEIKVKLVEAAPKPAEQTDLSELHWRLTLDPGRETTIMFSFSVEHPRSATVTGLLE